LQRGDRVQLAVQEESGQGCGHLSAAAQYGRASLQGRLSCRAGLHDRCDVHRARSRGCRVRLQGHRAGATVKASTMRTLFYDDEINDLPRAIFLAGPTSRSYRTAWRIEALEYLGARGHTGTVILPEFRDGNFEAGVPARFGTPPSPVPGMRA